MDSIAKIVQDYIDASQTPQQDSAWFEAVEQILDLLIKNGRSPETTLARIRRNLALPPPSNQHLDQIPAGHPTAAPGPAPKHEGGRHPPGGLHHRDGPPERGGVRRPENSGMAGTKVIELLCPQCGHLGLISNGRTHSGLTVLCTLCDYFGTIK